MLTGLIAVRLSGLSAGWVAGALMATFPVDVRYASILVPEPLLQAMVLLGALLFLLAERKRSVVFGVASGLCLGLSYLIKEPGALMVAAFILLALIRKEWRLTVAVAAGFALVMAAESAWYTSQSSDLSYRLDALVRHNDSMGVQPTQYLWYRLLRRYPRMMLVPGPHFGLHSLLALSLAGLAILRWRFSKEVLFLVVWASVPFLYLNFGTSSLQSYVALPDGPRYISPVYPPIFILAATVLADWMDDLRKRKIWVGAIVAITCAIGVFCALNLKGTGFRTDHVKRLKQIATTARNDMTRICHFEGPDGMQWQRILEVVAPDSIGCVGARYPAAAGFKWPPYDRVIPTAFAGSEFDTI